MTKILDQFKIEVLNFAEKKYEYDFNVEGEFFKAIEQDIVENGQLKVKAVLDRSTAMIKADFYIDGKVELTCDRTLKKFDHPIKAKHTILYKFSDRNEELTDEVTLIKTDTNEMDFSVPIYEFIALNIPLKKIHPDFITEQDTASDDNILIYSTLNDENEPIDNNIDILDPRWEALKKLKDTL